MWRGSSWATTRSLLALTSRAFRLYALSFVIMGFNVYASSFFTALGDGVTSALISFLRTLAFQVIAILLLPMLLGIDGIWLAVTAAELAALAVSAAMLLTPLNVTAEIRQINEFLRLFLSIISIEARIRPYYT